MSVRQSVLALSAMVAAVLALVVVGSEHPNPATPTARPVEQPIRSATLACPGAPGATIPPTSMFAVGPDPVVAGSSPDQPADRLEVVAAGAQGPRLDSSSQIGQPVRFRVGDVGAAGLLVRASGALAPGVTGAQLSTYRSTTEKGLAATWCESPRDDWWFNGVDTNVGTSTHLVLANPSAAVAVVDLRMLGADGVVDAAGSNGIPVAPRSRLVLDLARYAPGEPALTLHVTATRGTVGAAIATTRLDGVTPAGADWVPASTPPADTVVVDAGVGGVGHQSLVITNAGTRQQVVAVRILGQTGPYTSTGLPSLQVPPGSVVVKDVSDILAKQTTAIELSAAGPVAGALVSTQSGGQRDFAVSGLGAPLTTRAVVPALNGAALSLSFATGAPAPQRVRVRGFTSSGERAGSATVVVRGSATTGWKPSADWAAAYLVVTPPPDSDFRVVVSYVNAAGVTQLPLLSAPRTVLRPAVLPL